MKKTFTKIILTVSLVLTLLSVFGQGSLGLISEPVFAQDKIFIAQSDGTNYARSGMNDLAGKLGLQKENGDLISKIAGFVRIVLVLLGGALLILFIVAGFMRMFAMGVAEKIKKSNDIMISAVTGLLIIAVSYIFVNWILMELTKF
jgi:hypothetical protein